MWDVSEIAMLCQLTLALLTQRAAEHNADAETNKMSGAKSEAWKTALGVFFGVLAVSFCWHWIAKTTENALWLFGSSAGIAVFVYFLRRTDLFD